MFSLVRALSNRVGPPGRTAKECPDAPSLENSQNRVLRRGIGHIPLPCRLAFTYVRLRAKSARLGNLRWLPSLRSRMIPRLTATGCRCGKASRVCAVYGRGFRDACFRAMELITILNRCHHFRGFVYQHARFSADHKRIEVSVRPRKGSATICSRCHQTARPVVAKMNKALDEVRAPRKPAACSAKGALRFYGSPAGYSSNAT